MKRITFAVDENGNPLGEAHHNAKLTDEDVELIRDIYDEGLVGYKTLAKVFGVSKGTIYDIVNFRRRVTTPAGYRTVDAETRRKPVPKSRLKQLGIEYAPPELDEDWDNSH